MWLHVDELEQSSSPRMQGFTHEHTDEATVSDPSQLESHAHIVTDADPEGPDEWSGQAVQADSALEPLTVLYLPCPQAMQVSDT